MIKKRERGQTSYRKSESTVTAIDGSDGCRGAER